MVLPELSARHGGLVIDLQQRTAIVSGWSKPKPLKIGLDTIDTLSDPIDRELVSMMLGGIWVTQHEANQTHRLDRGHNTYRVASGAQRSILKRMINTGRAFLELEEDPYLNKSRQRPLRWAGDDTPWKLWLIGRPAPGELLVDIQLRRAGKRLAVTEPEVILGGRDGLVILNRSVETTRSRYAVATAAPFDDRDAFRWVGQFRDHRYADDGPDADELAAMEEDGLATEGAEAVEGAEASDMTGATVPVEAEESVVGVSALRIPDADVPRFLERLYLLPQLPELDLPEGMGRAERMLDPVPHLDVHSPGSPQAAELLASAGRNSLVARVGVLTMPVNALVLPAVGGLCLRPHLLRLTMRQKSLKANRRKLLLLTLLSFDLHQTRTLLKPAQHPSKNKSKSKRRTKNRTKSKNWCAATFGPSENPLARRQVWGCVTPLHPRAMFC